MPYILILACSFLACAARDRPYSDLAESALHGDVKSVYIYCFNDGQFSEKDLTKFDTTVAYRKTIRRYNRDGMITSSTNVTDFSYLSDNEDPIRFRSHAVYTFGPDGRRSGSREKAWNYSGDSVEYSAYSGTIAWANDHEYTVTYFDSSNQEKSASRFLLDDQFFIYRVEYKNYSIHDSLLFFSNADYSKNPDGFISQSSETDTYSEQPTIHRYAYEQFDRQGNPELILLHQKSDYSERKFLVYKVYEYYE
jgi:hypothetical protein